MRQPTPQEDWVELCRRYPYLGRVTRSFVREPRVPAATPPFQLCQLLAAIRYSGFRHVLKDVLIEILAEDMAEISQMVFERMTDDAERTGCRSSQDTGEDGTAENGGSEEGSPREEGS